MSISLKLILIMTVMASVAAGRLGYAWKTGRIRGRWVTYDRARNPEGFLVEFAIELALVIAACALFGTAIARVGR